MTVAFFDGRARLRPCFSRPGELGLQAEFEPVYLVDRLYGGLIRLLAVCAALLMVAVMLTVCADVLIRNLGHQPAQATPSGH